MAELASYHSAWNEILKAGILNDIGVINGAVNSDEQNALTEIESAMNRIRVEIMLKIIDTPAANKNGVLTELDAYFKRDRKPPLAKQLYDLVISSDAYKAKRLEAEAAAPGAEEPPA